MSHLKLKNVSINVKTNKVFITGYENNVYPKIASKYESEMFSEILKNNGVEAVEREIFEAFVQGNFQGKSTFYGKIYYLSKNDNIDEMMQLLKQIRQTKENFIAKVGEQYVYKVTTARAFYSQYLEKAKHFNLLESLMIKKRFGSRIELHSIINAG